MASEVYTLNITVPASAIDERDHVNNLVYLDWCLKAAESHWQKKATPEMLETYVWYVLHHSIDYKAPAFENDLLEIQTWVQHSEGVRSERNYRIKRMADQKILVEAKTIWCLLDSGSLKPTKIPDDLIQLFTKA